MSHEFVHLHVHTDYSMLDGASRISDLAEVAEQQKMSAAACTDHGNMCAVIEFYKAMKDRGVKPIVGCEFYVAPASRTERNPRHPHAQGYHLVLLAENLQGYQNLCRLNASAWLEGYYYKPRIDKEVLAEWSEGLLALSGCIAGEIPAYVLENNDKKAVASLQEYLDIFGRDRFYLELQDHGLPEQETANRRLLELSAEYGLPTVATNDSHYLNRDHAAAHDVLLCIGTQTTVEDPNRLRFSGTEFYFKSAEEMSSVFAEHPEALQNTLAVAERCNLALPLGDDAANHYPVYEVEGNTTREEFLRGLCLQGLSECYGIDVDAPNLPDEQREIVARMDYELGVIAKMRFTSYFLVVWDFLHYARQQGIPVGPGRGSGAGSLVAYLTRVTDIEPVRYGLLFERFLNPDRVSPPDFDIDLCERRRGEVIAYVREKYGSANVAQIGTFGTLKAKAVIKDVARALGYPFADSNRLTKAIPADPKMTLKRAVEESPELREMIEGEPWVREVLKHSEILEGLNRNMSIHAAGVIIGDQPLNNLVPLGKGATDEVITQYSAKPCEDLGLLKMDFLGLRTLTIIQDTVELIKENRGTALDIASILLDDPATFELLNKGNTVAVFQLESSGMRDLCRRFGVEKFEHIIALIALYRPGPMQFLDDFISRKMGQTVIEYDLPEMESILSETYGIMLYQEQVMQVVQKVANFSLGRADILRRAMGKKDPQVMAEQYDMFLSGCLENGVGKEKADSIWGKIVKFAGYGFNKSHSAAYAMLSYRTAHLKANYPTEFMAAVLSSELGNADKLAFFLKECQTMGIEVKPPDVNTSGLRFTVDKDAIRFGMAAIKGVGSAAAESVIEVRPEGPFKGLSDFCERVGSAVNRRVVENLCKSGAFDCFSLRRAQVFAMVDEAIAHSQQAAADRLSGQGSLFDLLEGDEDNPLDLVPPDLPEWGKRELLGHEKELLGFYVTGHPVDEFADVIRTFQLDTIDHLAELPEQTATRIGGILTKVDSKRSKKDNRLWAIASLEGLEGSIECMIFADVYDTCSELVIPENIVFLEGTLSRRDSEGTKLLATRAVRVEDAPQLYVKEVHLRLHQATVDQGKLQKLVEICRANAGQTPVILCLICASGEIAFVQPNNMAVQNSTAFRQAIRGLLGNESLVEKADKTRENGNGKRQRYQGRRSAPRPDAGVA